MRIEIRVQKFRSIEEMNTAPVHESRQSDFESFLRHCARYWAIASKRYRRSVFSSAALKKHRKLAVSTPSPVPTGCDKHTHNPLQIRIIHGSALVTALT